ncbi:UvrB/UvrC motif-containing protein [Stratiformator vulcanicus]|uniref:UvrB/UvrC motif-containing protein n=1 Tax=Stratiformator vulcanicus TaxID=2527980 RepID=UPI002877BF0F|nr:UvrB/UvrC motif-containing protein [Stratiformator vulcanicus]
MYHITEIHGGSPQEIHFCEGHFHEYMNSPAAQPTGSSPAKDAMAEFGDEVSESDDLTCPNCGITFREFREQGRFGCPYDYEAFADRLVPLLENIHGETQHVGKVPARAPLESRRQYELIRLRRDLAVAIDGEDYETAAKIRDDIRRFDGA